MLQLPETDSHCESYDMHFDCTQAEPCTALSGKTCLIDNAASKSPCIEIDMSEHECLTPSAAKTMSKPNTSALTPSAANS